MKIKPNKIKGIEAENQVVKTLNSGSLWFSKGDLRQEDYLIDSKSTDKKSFSITETILEKIHTEAFDSNKFPRLMILIERPDCKWFLKVDIAKEMK